MLSEERTRIAQEPVTVSANIRGEIVSSERIRLFVVDDHPLLVDGLTAVMENEPDMLPVGGASSGQEAIQLFGECRPDITLMDLRLPDMSGIDVMMAIRSKFPGARFIIFTTFAGDAEIQRALEAGARAYLLKTMPPQELMDVIRQVHAGGKSIPSEIAVHLAEHYSDEPLTKREMDILRQLAGGNRNRDIADKLFISEETVKAHLKHIMEKLGANDRTQAVAIAVRRGFIQL